MPGFTSRVSVLCLLVGLLSGCSSEGICTDVAVGASGFHSDLGFGQCWDGLERRVVCDPVGPGFEPGGTLAAPTAGAPEIRCTCSVAGNAGATFSRTEPLLMSTPPSEAELAPINAGCGWALRPR